MNALTDLPKVALSIRQPWAWLIVNGHKDIENRTWAAGLRGPFLIHAGTVMTERDYFAAWDLADDQGIDIPSRDELPRGGIVGVAEITGLVSAGETASPWFFGPVGFVLANARSIPFIPCKGRLGFFKPELPSHCNP